MIDTNILLSAMLFPGERMDALMRKASVENHLVISSYVLNELFDVIRRKFSSQEGTADRFFQRIPYELVYTPKQPEPGLFVIRDPDDYAVLYSAIMEDVDIFVTGDKDFGGIVLEKPEIVTPAQFLARQDY
jgi:putative PIN family toxin of toxin-antitoxin system